MQKVVMVHQRLYQMTCFLAGHAEKGEACGLIGLILERTKCNLVQRD